MRDELMHAIVFETPGDPGVLKVGKVPISIPSEGQVRIKVAAAGVNRADTLQRMGKYPHPPGASSILGLEVSGIIDAVGKGSTKWRRGDRVMALLPGGGYAGYSVIDEEMVMPLPVGMNFIQAAAIPEVFLTAYQSLVWHARLQPRETILIHAGASGVGTAAIQTALAIGAVPIVTASKEKHPLCQELGARATIDYKHEDFVTEVKNFTNGAGVDVILDFIGGSIFNKNIETLKTDGRLVILAALGGATVEKFNLIHILSRRIAVIGSTLRARQTEYQIRLTHEFWKFASPLFEGGSLRPVVDKIFPLEDAAVAHSLLEGNKTAGKLILIVDESIAGQ